MRGGRVCQDMKVKCIAEGLIRVILEAAVGAICLLFCRERANLAVQLKDTKSVVGRLKFVISIVLHIVFIFFYLMIYNVSPTLF